MRAKILYELYHTCLKKINSPIRVNSIILEEEEHLQEMQKSISEFTYSHKLCEKISKFEENLYNKWIGKITNEINIS